MHTQDALVNDRRDGEVVKHRAEVPPEGKTVATLALVVEAVQSRDGVALVVASQQVNHVWPFYFVCQQETHRLNALLAAIHVVPDH